MSNTNTDLAALEAEMNSKNAALKKAVDKTLRAGGVPTAFAVEKKEAMIAYRAYWAAVDAKNAEIRAMVLNDEIEDDAAKGGAL